jgi:hypothetical protein
VEGTGSYGAGLPHHLKAAGIAVVDGCQEIEAPPPIRHGKSDPKGTQVAARAVLSGETAGLVPKNRDGKVEMIRTLKGAHRSAVKACIQAVNLLVSATSSPRRWGEH